MVNSLNWFEIPVNDFARAKKFYETLYGTEIMEMPFPDGQYGMLPCDMQNGVGGGIVKGNGFMAHIIDMEGNRVALHSMK